MPVGARGQGALLLGVDPAETASLVNDPGVRCFQVRGREADGWLQIAPEAVGTNDELRAWVRHGVTYARSLPPR